MSPALRCDLLVVGGGPAGSALAAAAARHGMDVVVVERAAHPRPKACAEYASPRIADELERLAVSDDAWRRAAVPLDGMELRLDGVSVPIRYADRAGYRPAWGLDRPRFDAALADHARACGARVEERTSVVRLAREGGRVTGAVVRGPAGELEIAARWVAGADGVRSAVARLTGAVAPVGFPRRLGLVAHYEGTRLGREHMGQMHVGERHYVGLAPLPGGRLNVAMALPLDGDGSATRRFDAALQALPAARRALADATGRSPIRGVAPIGQRARPVAGPGWLLVGDAAGFVDPFTGEGIYRALRSARAAADALAAEPAGAGADRVAARYAAERRAAFAAKDALTWVVQGLLAAPPLLRYAGRRLAARPAAALRLGSALGDCRPATEALTPAFLWEVLRP